jgi:hypothetical protein
VSVFLPAPVRLTMPPGDVDGLGDLSRDVSSAAFRLALLDGYLAGPASWAPGWLGDDAAAAMTQLGRLVELVGDGAATLDTVARRLADHHEAVESARAFVRSLQEHQEADFSVAEYRLARLVDYAAQASSVTEDPQAAAVVAELEAAEADRRRQNAAVLEEVAVDAARTAAVLADACHVVGGTGERGDGLRAVVHLAALLPGWGDRELARRGRAIAEDLTGLVAEGEWDESMQQARRAAVLAAIPAFASALLTGLGATGLRELLLHVGQRDFDDDLAGNSSDVARLLATALGAAGRSPDAETEGVLDGAYVDPRAEGLEPDLVAIGMAMVLAAPVANGGPVPMTVATWTRQVLARERALVGHPEGATALERVHPAVEWEPSTYEDSFGRFDPVPALVGWLAAHGTAQSAAAALGERADWTLLLDRSWDDGGAALADLVSLSAAHPGAAGARAAWSGLAAVGGGLVEGDPDDRTVDRDLVDRVAPALGQAVAAHVLVVTAALTEVASGEPSDGAGDVARGLAYVTVDRAAADAITGALSDWAAEQSRDLSGTTPARPLAAVAVPSAFVAVQEYGQRLAHALDGYEAKEAAEFGQRVWDATVGLATNLVPGPAGIAAGLAEGYLAIWFDLDGTWGNPVDRGLLLDAGDAAGSAIDHLDPEERARIAAVSAQARSTYERVIGVLGRPEAPVSPDHDYLEPVLDALVGVAGDKVGRVPQAPSMRGIP